MVQINCGLSMAHILSSSHEKPKLQSGSQIVDLLLSLINDAVVSHLLPPIMIKSKTYLSH